MIKINKTDTTSYGYNRKMWKLRKYTFEQSQFNFQEAVAYGKLSCFPTAVDFRNNIPETSRLSESVGINRANTPFWRLNGVSKDA